ncbi:unnamed protein product, partial [Effrenium voratum]
LRMPPSCPAGRRGTPGRSVAGTRTAASTPSTPGRSAAAPATRGSFPAPSRWMWTG